MSRPIPATELARLLDEHAAALELYASQWTLAAEDCVQDAFIELAAQLDQPPLPAAWLYRVVRNKAINARRSAIRRVNHERLASMLTPPFVSSPFGANIGLAEDKKRLMESLESLSAAERELVVLRIWSGMTWQQIADLTLVSSSSAQRNYVAALRKLKQILEPACQETLKFRPS